jgi:hypothetical protein
MPKVFERSVADINDDTIALPSSFTARRDAALASGALIYCKGIGKEITPAGKIRVSNERKWMTDQDRQNFANANLADVELQAWINIQQMTVIERLVTPIENS